MTWRLLISDPDTCANVCVHVYVWLDLYCSYDVLLLAQVLRQLIGRDLPSSVAVCCGQEAVVQFALARADLYIALASTSPSLTTLTRSTNLTRPPTQLSPMASPIATPPPSSSSSANPDSRSTTIQRQSAQIHSVLLEEAERILHLCLSLSPPSPELRATIYLSLSQLALSLHHSLTAMKLSLSALRLTQSSKSPGLSGRATCRLWLKSRLTLARSLLDQQQQQWVRESGCEPLLSCETQCGDGAREAERFGEIELCAKFHFTAALRALSLSPPDTETIATHSQQCLQLLASLPHLSPPLSLLHTHCTLLLCDIGRRSGHVTSHDAVTVYQNLAKKLKQQVKHFQLSKKIAKHFYNLSLFFL